MFVSDKLLRLCVAITTGSCMHTQVPYTYTGQLLSSLWSALSSLGKLVPNQLGAKTVDIADLFGR